RRCGRVRIVWGRMRAGRLLTRHVVPGCGEWRRPCARVDAVARALVVAQLAVFEPVEIGVQPAPGQILAGDADEVAGEAAGQGVLVGEDRRVLLPAHGMPVLAVARVRKADAAVVDGQL